MENKMSLFTQTNKVSGVIKANGTSSSGVISNITTSSPNLGIYGSVVVDNDDLDPVAPGAILNYSNQRPIAKKVTTKLNVFDNTVLQSGASVPSLRRNVMKIEGITTRKLTTSLREGKYNMFTNTFASTCGDGDDQCPDVSVDDFGTDTAAEVSVNNTGKLFYTLGNREPVVETYKSND
jgi:carbamoylphosphate synthase small subunit